VKISQEHKLFCEIFYLEHLLFQVSPILHLLLIIIQQDHTIKIYPTISIKNALMFSEIAVIPVINFFKLKNTNLPGVDSW